MNRKRKYLIPLIGWSIIALVIFAVAYWIQPLFSHNQFDSTLWKNGDTRIRGKMVYSLRDNRVLISKSKLDLVTIIGEPPKKRNTKWQYPIDLGYKKWFSPFLYSFTIEFDSINQFVKNTEISD